MFIILIEEDEQLTLIIYATKHGAVRTCAEILSEKLADDCTITHIKHDQIPSLDEYSSVILGFSVHAGSIPASIKKFTEDHIGKLKGKRFGLFCSCLSEEDQAISYFHKNFSTEVIKATKTIGIFGAEVTFEKMNPFERFIMKKITRRRESFSTINQENIGEFVRLFELPQE